MKTTQCTVTFCWYVLGHSGRKYWGHTPRAAGMRQHYTPTRPVRPLAGAALAIAIGLVLAVLLVRYL